MLYYTRQPVISSIKDSGDHTHVAQAVGADGNLRGVHLHNRDITPSWKWPGAEYGTASLDVEGNTVAKSAKKRRASRT